jgi:GNAT superfamily N-acetyltransferase
LGIHYRTDEEINDEEDRALRALLFSCFSFNPVFLARRWFRQRPGHRWLMMDGVGEIVAHAAVHERLIGTAAGGLQIGGIAEVCVAPAHRGQGIARELLQTMEMFMQAREIPFAMLFGQPRVYASSGYVPIENELKTDNLLSHHWNPFCGTAMIKPLTGQPWPHGLIDLCGPTF